ncbi:MAG TPA: metallophosphoesterase [Acidobacteriaceae bacterium]|nr:metallophosphoesterase [Acidobacteriaceae bacterium]
MQNKRTPSQLDAPATSDEAQLSPHDGGPGDGIDRRNFLSCMAWAGTGLLWSMAGGVPVSNLVSAKAATPTRAAAGSAFSFVQISDSHIGFNKAANQDVAGTLKLAIDKIDAMPVTPAFMLHTGDITQSAKASEFDNAQQIIRGSRIRDVHYVPGEHDTATDDGALYRERFGKGTLGSGWYSFDHQGVHFVGLNNSLQVDAMGGLGPDQLDWMKKDLAAHSASTPVVVFAHIPLWMVYPEWGWGTKDGEQALSYLKRFGSVTVLNGHIHQVVQKVEGNVSFHTAASTAFPQPSPGKARSAGPMVVPAGKLRSVLGVTEVKYIPRRGPLAVIDSSLEQKG